MGNPLELFEESNESPHSGPGEKGPGLEWLQEGRNYDEERESRIRARKNTLLGKIMRGWKVSTPDEAREQAEELGMGTQEDPSLEEVGMDFMRAHWKEVFCASLGMSPEVYRDLREESERKEEQPLEEYYGRRIFAHRMEMVYVPGEEGEGGYFDFDDTYRENSEADRLALKELKFALNAGEFDAFTNSEERKELYSYVSAAEVAYTAEWALDQNEDAQGAMCEALDDFENGELTYEEWLDEIYGIQEEYDLIPVVAEEEKEGEEKVEQEIEEIKEEEQEILEKLSLGEEEAEVLRKTKDGGYVLAVQGVQCEYNPKEAVIRWVARGDGKRYQIAREVHDKGELSKEIKIGIFGAVLTERSIPFDSVQPESWIETAMLARQGDSADFTFDEYDENVEVNLIGFLDALTPAGRTTRETFEDLEIIQDGHLDYDRLGEVAQRWQEESVDEPRAEEFIASLG